MGKRKRMRRSVILVRCEGKDVRLTEHGKQLALTARAMSRLSSSVDPTIICCGNESRLSIASFLITELGVDRLRVSAEEGMPETLVDFYCKLTGRPESLRRARVTVVSDDPWLTFRLFLIAGRIVTIQHCYRFATD